MNEKISSVTPEYIEEVRSHAAWLGGFFEIGSTLLIEMKGSGRWRYPGLYMRVFDNAESKINRFRALFGGAKHQKGNSWELSFGIAQASVLGASLAPFAPSKSDVAKVIGEWEHLTAKEREMQKIFLDELEQNKSIKPEDYQELVKNPDFVAGVLENRAILFTRENRRPFMRVYSQNLPLLMVLRTEFGGEVEAVTEHIEARSRYLGVDQRYFHYFGKRWVVDEGLETILSFTDGHHLLIPENFAQVLQRTKNINMPGFELPPVKRQDIIEIVSHLSTGLGPDGIRADGTFTCRDGTTLFSPEIMHLWNQQPLVRVTNPQDYSLSSLSFYRQEDVGKQQRPKPFKRINNERLRIVQERKPNLRLGRTYYTLIILSPSKAQINSGFPRGDARNFVSIREG